MTMTQLVARQHARRAAQGSMSSLEILLRELIGGDVALDNLTITTGTITALITNGVTGGDASLGITGVTPLTTVDGGIVAIAGGASIAGATGAGGAVSVAGGASGSTAGAGGAVAVSGGLGTTTGAGGAISAIAGAGGSNTTVTGAVGGAVTVTSGAGGATTTGVGGASGAVTLASGDGGAISGDSDANASGASGIVTLKSGNAGAHAAGTAAAGAAGNVLVTSGNGGADTEAGDGTGGIGGDVIVTAGTGGTGGTAGKSGGIFLRPGGTTATPLQPVMRSMGVPTGDASGAAVLTTADMLNGVYVNTPAASVAVTTPTGVQLTDAIGLVADGGSLVVGDSFDWSMINLGSTGQIITLTAGDANVTFIGDVTLDPGVAAEGSGSGMWRFRYTSADAWVGYRIA